jgi:glutamate 5-kinase
MTAAIHPSSAMPLLRARRIVVKVGSALLVDAQEGSPKHAWLETLAADVAAIRARGQEVLLVSSGAIALGRHQLGLRSASRTPGRMRSTCTG